MLDNILPKASTESHFSTTDHRNLKKKKVEINRNLYEKNEKKLELKLSKN